VENQIFVYGCNNFFSTGYLGKNPAFPQGIRGEKEINFLNSFFLQFPQQLWKNHQRQELIFAVMSRMWFCRLVSLALMALSTFLME